MEYVEYLRVRRALVSYAVALAFCFAVVMVVLHAHGGIHIVIKFDKGGVTLGSLLEVGALAALFLATAFGSNLAAEGATLPFLWTKPVSRTVLALRFVVVDALAIAAGIAVCTLIAIVVVFANGPGAAITFAGLGPDAALALGAPLAWYGIAMLVSARLPRDAAARAAAGLWPVFILIGLLGTVTLPPAAHALVVAFEHVDPLMLLLGVDERGMGLLALGSGPRAAACWGIALMTIAIAIPLWASREG